MESKHKIEEQTKRKQTYNTEDKLMVARGRGIPGLDVKGEGLKKYKWVVKK